MTRDEFIRLSDRDMGRLSLYGYTPNLEDVEELQACVRILAQLLTDSQKALSAMLREIS